MRRLPMFPLSAVLLPHESIPLVVFEPRYRVMMADCLSHDRSFGIVLIERGWEVGGGDQRSNHGALATIERIHEVDGRLLLLVTGRDRLEVRQWLEDDPYPIAMVELSPPAGRNGLAARLDLLAERVRYVRELWSDVYEAPLRVDAGGQPEAAGEEERLWRLCSMAPFGELDRYRLLRTEQPVERLDLLEVLIEEQRVDLELLRDQGKFY